MDVHAEGMSVGKEGLMTMNELAISVVVCDARVRLLVVEYLVEPTAGTGKMWVESGKVRIN